MTGEVKGRLIAVTPPLGSAAVKSIRIAQLVLSGENCLAALALKADAKRVLSTLGISNVNSSESRRGNTESLAEKSQGNDRSKIAPLQINDLSGRPPSVG